MDFWKASLIVLPAGIAAASLWLWNRNKQKTSVPHSAQSFVHSSLPIRTVFHKGAVQGTKVMEELELLKVTRVMILCTPSKRAREKAENLAQKLGDKVVSIWPKVEQHTRHELIMETIIQVKENNIDCLLAYGGGSATGLAKGVNALIDVPCKIMDIPTTYSGSEMTNTYGIVRNKEKTSSRSPKVVANTVIYDIEEMVSLTLQFTTESSINALAHVVEALWSKDCNPFIEVTCIKSIESIKTGLEMLRKFGPSHERGRYELIVGAWLSGMTLGTVGMGIHHKMAHVLGGSFSLEHSRVHTVLLPHSIAFNASAAPRAMEIIRNCLGTNDAAKGVYDFAKKGNAILSLKELGFKEDNIEKAASLIMTAQYDNPKSVTKVEIVSLLKDAYYGREPSVYI